VEDADAAASWLQVAWDEGIESLMMSFAAYDLSFDEMKTSPAFEEAIGLASEMELGVERLGGSVCRLSGAGSNVVAQVGDDGVFLIDTGSFPVFASLQRAVSLLESGEVSRPLITHPHEDHMGAAAELGAAATVGAHSARPDVEIASDTIIVVNGEEVRIFATPAHTSGDLVIYFTESGVVVSLLEQEAGDTDGDADPNETNKRCRDVD